MVLHDAAVGAVTSGTGTTLWLLATIVIGGGLGLIILGFAAWWWFIKKRWNIKAEIKLTRSGGNLTHAEWGKAYFNVKRGVCFVKRPGMGQKAVAIPIFDIRKYLQGDNIVSFVQLSPEDLRPILNDSWEEYEEDQPMKDENGKIIIDEEGNPVHEKAAMINIKIDSGLNKAWRTAWNAAAKNAYSLKSFFTQFQTPIAIAIVIIAVFVGFAMMWTRLGSVCGG